MNSSTETNRIVANDTSIYLPIKILAFISVCLTTVTVYICIITSFFTHSEVISNYTLSECSGVKSNLPPVSYSIGSWEPQKQLWMLVLILHLPSRALIMMMVAREWTQFIWRRSFYTAVTLEILGLVCVTIFPVNSSVGFYVHAASFGVWWAASICAMGIGIVIHVRRISGHVRGKRFKYHAWIAKIVIMTLFVIVSFASSIAYVYSQRFCSLPAFTLFILGEYILIALNAAFWAVVVFAFSRDFDGFRIFSIKKKLENQTIEELSVYSIICKNDHSTTMISTSGACTIFI